MNYGGYRVVSHHPFPPNPIAEPVLSIPTSSQPKATPPPPDPPPLPPDPSPSVAYSGKPSGSSNSQNIDKVIQQSWTSFLFKRKPQNAGKYIPVKLIPTISNGTLKLIQGVPEAGTEVREDSVVDFFLDKPLSYTAVVEKLNSLWKLEGSVKVKSDGVLFLFDFSCVEDKNRILQADPIIMNKKVFIIKKFDPTTSNVCGKVKSVPVWVKFYNLPIFAWSNFGVNWISSMLGNLLCMDEMTESRQRIQHAKCLIEVKPDKELVNDFLVETLEGGVQRVYVEYLWKPDICSLCRSFGHINDNCDKEDKSGEENIIQNRMQQENILSNVGVPVNNRKQVQSNENNNSWQKVGSRRNNNVVNANESGFGQRMQGSWVMKNKKVVVEVQKGNSFGVLEEGEIEDDAERIEVIDNVEVGFANMDTQEIGKTANSSLDKPLQNERQQDTHESEALREGNEENAAEVEVYNLIEEFVMQECLKERRKEIKQGKTKVDEAIKVKDKPATVLINSEASSNQVIMHEIDHSPNLLPLHNVNTSKAACMNITTTQSPTHDPNITLLSKSRSVSPIQTSDLSIYSKIKPPAAFKQPPLDSFTPVPPDISLSNVPTLSTPSSAQKQYLLRSTKYKGTQPPTV